MNTKAIFLDLDHTLLDTDGWWWKFVPERIAALGIPEAQWFTAYEQVWKTGYSLEKHIATLAAERVEIPEQLLFETIFYSFGALPSFLFLDVVSFLERAGEAGWSAYLLSFGNRDWQSRKVEALGLRKFFHDVLLTEAELDKAAQILGVVSGYQQVVFVDNNPKELDAVRQRVPGTATYRMNRVPDEYLSFAGQEEERRYMEARRYVGIPSSFEHASIRSLEEVSL